MKARKWVIQLANDEWGSTLMRNVARERFESDHTLDCITVNEHGGWFLSFNRDLVVIGTANDMAVLDTKAHIWARQFSGIEVVGIERRQHKAVEHFDSYWPRLASAVA